jgi:hypothetical protein
LPWRPRPILLCPQPGGGELHNVIYWCKVIRLNFSYVSDFRSECNLMLIVTCFLFCDNMVGGPPSHPLPIFRTHIFSLPQLALRLAVPCLTDPRATLWVLRICLHIPSTKCKI